MSEAVIARKNPTSTNIGKLSKYLSRRTPPIPKTNIGVMIEYPRLHASPYADHVLSSIFFIGLISCCQFLPLILFFVFLLF